MKKVLLIIPSYYAEYLITEGTVAVQNDDIVSNDDVLKVLQTCVVNKVPSNKEFVSITPIEFSLDDSEDKIDDPKGMKAKILKCKGVLSLAPKKNVYTAVSLLENIGVNIVDINFGSVCDYFEFKTDSLDKKNAAVINLPDLINSLK
mgnify:CR=1 FL=1